jgi:hypothetical protein
MAGLGKIPQPGQARISEVLETNELQNLTARISRPGPVLYSAIYSTIQARGSLYYHRRIFFFKSIYTSRIKTAI